MHEDILNELRTPVFLINKRNIIEYVNPIGEELLGYSAKLITGKTLDFFINEDYIVIKQPSVPLLTGGDYNQLT